MKVGDLMGVVILTGFVIAAGALLGYVLYGLVQLMLNVTF